MVGWHHRLYKYEFEQDPEVSDGQGSLACCSPWGHKELDMTEVTDHANIMLISMSIKIIFYTHSCTHTQIKKRE